MAGLWPDTRIGRIAERERKSGAAKKNKGGWGD